MEFTCPWCGGKVACEPWIRGDRGYMTCGVCPEDEEEFLFQLWLHHLRDDDYRVRRLVYEMCDDLWDIYQDRTEPLGV